MPAGLIDDGETPEQAAIRELEEETGFKASGVLEATPTVVCDPGTTHPQYWIVITRAPRNDDSKHEAGRAQRESGGQDGDSGAKA
jgi:ADP-ribose pyrophosphatase